MRKRIHSSLAAALLAIAPILAACSDGSSGSASPTEPPPLPSPPPPPPDRNAILGTNAGTRLPYCIDEHSDRVLVVAYDALEAPMFELDFLADRVSLISAGKIEVHPPTSPLPSGVGLEAEFRVEATPAVGFAIVDTIEVLMLSADGSGRLDADPNPRVFRSRHLPVYTSSLCSEAGEGEILSVAWPACIPHDPERRRFSITYNSTKEVYWGVIPEDDYLDSVIHDDSKDDPMPPGQGVTEHFDIWADRGATGVLDAASVWLYYGFYLDFLYDRRDFENLGLPIGCP